MPALTVDVHGIPVSQGSMVSNGYGRGMRHSNAAKLKPWRSQVISELLAHKPKDWDPAQPISVTATFRLPRPATHYGTGRNRDKLKASAPEHHITKSDLDKLLRAVFDAVEQSGLARGDQQICSVNAAKRYCIEPEPPGVLITLISFNPVA